MKKSNRAIIVSNGDIKKPALTYKRITSEYGFSSKDLIIGADGGAKNSLKLNLTPDVIIGDMDSIEKEAKTKLNAISNNIKYIKTSPDKDKSDTHLAVEYAVKLKVKKIIITGAIGDRLDHSLANIFMLSSFFLKNMDVKILTDTSEISVVRKSCSIKGKTGNIISMFSLTPYTYFIKTTGLKYVLEEEKLFFSPIRGLSNIFTQDVANIKIRGGIILLIKQI